MLLSKNLHNDGCSDIFNGFKHECIKIPHSITNNELSNYSNTGDILLYRSCNSTARIIRQATSGEYDHIGMVFRLKHGRICVLESLGKTGGTFTVHVFHFLFLFF